MQANKEPDTGTDDVHEPEALGNAAKPSNEGSGDAVAETAKPKAQAAKRPTKKADGAATGKAEPKKAAAAKTAAGKAAKASSKAVPKKTAAKEAAGKKAVGKAGPGRADANKKAPVGKVRPGEAAAGKKAPAGKAVPEPAGKAAPKQAGGKAKAANKPQAAKAPAEDAADWLAEDTADAIEDTAEWPVEGAASPATRDEKWRQLFQKPDIFGKPKPAPDAEQLAPFTIPKTRNPFKIAAGKLLQRQGKDADGKAGALRLPWPLGALLALCVALVVIAGLLFYIIQRPATGGSTTDSPAGTGAQEQAWPGEAVAIPNLAALRGMSLDDARATLGEGWLDGDDPDIAVGAGGVRVAEVKALSWGQSGAGDPLVLLGMSESGTVLSAELISPMDALGYPPMPYRDVMGDAALLRSALNSAGISPDATSLAAPPSDATSVYDSSSPGAGAAIGDTWVFSGTSTGRGQESWYLQVAYDYADAQTGRVAKARTMTIGVY